MTAAVETGGCLPRAPWTDLGRVDTAAILAALQAHERLRCERVAQASSARVNMGCELTPPRPIWSSETPNSPHTQSSENSSILTT
jgi:hypothetical protein